MVLARRCTIVLVTLTTALAATAALAQATGTSVQAAVRGQDKAIAANPTIRKVLKGGAPKSLPQAIKLFTTLERKLGHAAVVVSQATATTAQDKTGQTDWVAAARLEAKAFSQVVTEFKDLERHDKAAAKREAQVARKTYIATSKLTAKADAELGLPAGA